MTSSTAYSRPSRPEDRWGRFRGHRSTDVAAFRIILLVAGVSGALLRPWRLPAWLAPVACAVVVVAAGGISPALARHALHPLVGPIAFLLAAVPLAVLLDRLGFF